jgi:hypothetical protein
MRTLQHPESAEQSSRRTGLAIETSIDRSPGRAFLVLSVFYFVVVASLSQMKLLWLDELITLHIARLGSLSAMWQALARGVDPNPPVTYLLVHASRAVFGDNELADRLPATAGYWVGMLALFLYLKRRLPGTWALAGTVLSMTMAAFDYSFESRSYGIFYGLAMLAFLCWTWAIDASSTVPKRSAALLGLTLALAAGISTNYFAVLAFLPIVAGEAMRTILRMRRPLRYESAWTRGLIGAIDWRIWIAVAVAACPLLIYRPLIEHSIAQFAPYAWNKVSLGQVADSYTEMVEVVLYPILALLVLALSVWLLTPRIERICEDCRGRLLPAWLERIFTRRATLSLPLEEGAAIFFLMAYPLLGYVIASMRGGMLSPRFVIPVCFGFAIAATLTAYQLFRDIPQAGVVFLCFVTAWFMCRESYVGYWYEEQKQCFYKIIDRVPVADQAVPEGAPIVIPDPLLAPTFVHYAPQAMAERVIFPVDFPAVRFYRHDDSPEENLWAGRGFLYSMPIVPLGAFQSNAGRYLILTSDSNWLLEDLRRHSYNVDRLPIVTRADAIGGFTPLAHGTPVFYMACGDRAPWHTLPAPSAPALSGPIRFRAVDNLPDSKSLDESGVNP